MTSNNYSPFFQFISNKEKVALDKALWDIFNNLYIIQVVYLAGVMAASLGTSITDPDNYIGNKQSFVKKFCLIICLSSL